MRVLLVLLMICSPLFNFGQRFHSGLMFGGTATQVVGDGFSGYNKVGITGGVYTRTKIGQHTSLELLIGYTQKGSFDPANPEIGKFTTYRIRQNYIEIPLMLDYEIKRKFFAETGLGFGYLFSYRLTDNFGDLPDSDFDFRPFEMSFLFGAGYKRDQWTFRLRNGKSVLPVADELAFDRNWWFVGGSYNWCWYFTASYTFPQ